MTIGIIVAVAFVLGAPSCSGGAEAGVRGDVVYVGGPVGVTPSSHLEPGRVAVYDDQGARVAAASFGEGHSFSIALSPGNYRVVAHSGDALCPERVISVEAGTYSTVRFSCDVR